MSTAEKTPSTINKIFHHIKPCPTAFVPGGLRLLGAADVDVALKASWERHTPSPGTTVEQFALVHVPLLRIWLELEHERQLLGPAPTQLEQLWSQF